MNLNLKRPGFVERELRCSTGQARGQSKPLRVGSLYLVLQAWKVWGERGGQREAGSRVSYIMPGS